MPIESHDPENGEPSAMRRRVTRPSRDTTDQPVAGSRSVVFVAIAVILVAIACAGAWFLRPATSGATSWSVSSNLPRAPGQHQLRFSATVGGKTIDVPYLLHLPVGYGKDGELWPLLVYLHDQDANGTDLKGVLGQGPAAHLATDATFKAAYSFIGVSPQCPRGWDDPAQIQAVQQLLDEVTAKLAVNRDRCYCTGTGSGGTGTWLSALASPERWAAIAPISATLSEPVPGIEALREVSAWIINGETEGANTASAKRTYELLAGSGCNAQFTTVPPDNLGVAKRFYTDPAFYLWFLQCHRPSARERADRARLRDFNKPVAVGKIAAVSVDPTKLRKGGLRGSYFHGTNLEKLAFERFDTKIDVPDRAFPYPDKRQDDISVRWTGYVFIETPGVYTFSTAADDGQRLWIGKSALVDDWNMHGVVEMSGTAELAKGFHPIRIEYMQGMGGASITVTWSGPGRAKQLLQGDVLYTEPWTDKK